MNTILSAVVSVLSFRFRRRASLELELVALRHQVAVLRRQRPGRLRIFSTDRLLWRWLYRIWPRALNAMALVKLATDDRFAFGGGGSAVTPTPLQARAFELLGVGLAMQSVRDHYQPIY